MESLRADLEASLPGLRACRQLLVVIPASFEGHPRIVDLLHDHETLGRLRRIHSAFGDALREERAVITFRVVDETFKVHLLDERQIDAAHLAANGGRASIPNGASSPAPA